MNIQDKILAGGKVACFGSRETPERVLKYMSDIARYICKMNGIVASGHCHGADLAFEQGASLINEGSNMHVCLPWATYNKDILAPKKAKVETLTSLPYSEQQELMTEASKHHGAWDRLSNGGRLLQARNLLIGRNSVLGICYMNKAKPGGGGTGQCYRYLISKGVQVFDLSDNTASHLLEMAL